MGEKYKCSFCGNEPTKENPVITEPGGTVICLKCVNIAKDTLGRSEKITTILNLRFSEIESIDNYSEVNPEELIRLLLKQPWHKKCTITPDYMPPNPREDTKPSVQISYDDGTDYHPCLRYSKGPAGGSFWDVYGDDFITVELAILAIHRAPAPVDVGPITFKLNLDKSKDK